MSPFHFYTFHLHAVKFWIIFPHIQLFFSQHFAILLLSSISAFNNDLTIKVGTKAIYLYGVEILINNNFKSSLANYVKHNRSREVALHLIKLILISIPYIKFILISILYSAVVFKAI